LRDSEIEFRRTAITMLDGEFIAHRSARWLDRAEYRLFCWRCRRPRSACYCSLVQPFESEPRFIILTQPREAKHRLGTGRMAHLCLANSSLFEGVDFSDDKRVNREINDPAHCPVLLYLSPSSINLTRLLWSERPTLFPSNRKLVVFVLDGTWKSVRKMIRLSKNLARLPKICFDAPTPSAYRIRREPRPQCYSTIEAIHQVIELLTPRLGHQAPFLPPHDILLAVFRSVIDRQLAYTA
jgi:DTW domain-containing protein YfiP